MIWFLYRLFCQKHLAPPSCPEFVPDLPPFINDIQRNRLETSWVLDEYEDMVDKWSRYLDDPNVTENNRNFLEAQWRK